MPNRSDLIATAREWGAAARADGLSIDTPSEVRDFHRTFCEETGSTEGDSLSESTLKRAWLMGYRGPVDPADPEPSDAVYANPSEYYAALDAVVALITEALDSSPIGTNYQSGGHVAYAVWDVESTDGSHSLVSVILADTLGGCEFSSQPIGNEGTSYSDLATMAAAVTGAKPCRIERTSLGGGVICAECGDNCECIVCAL